jgi:hypothetical protein
LAILPSLSFASGQTASSPDLSGYQLTQKVLTTYFRTASSFNNLVTTKPDNAKITVSKPNKEDIIVNFQVECSTASENDFAPGLRKDLVTVAVIETLNKKISETETWPSWIARPLTGYTEEHWLDDGIACKYIKGQYEKNYRISCHGSMPRELFDAMQKNAEKFEAMKQQADKASK